MAAYRGFMAAIQNDYIWTAALERAYSDAARGADADGGGALAEPPCAFPSLECETAITTALKSFEPEVMELARRATSLGARIYCSPPAFGLLPTDTILPVCAQGINRSQVCFLAACGAVRAMGADPQFRVLLPHGAASSFDPHQRFEGLTAHNYVEYLYDTPPAPEEMWGRGFASAFGRDRATRFGTFDLGHLVLNPDDRAMTRGELIRAGNDRRVAREWFNKRYFSQKSRGLEPRGGRRVFITFCGAFPITLRRLIEVAMKDFVEGRTEAPLANIVVIGLPWPDRISSFATESAIRERVASSTARGEPETPDEATVALYSAAYLNLFGQCVRMFRPAAA
jgi:hypothetical protein